MPLVYHIYAVQGFCACTAFFFLCAPYLKRPGCIFTALWAIHSPGFVLYYK